GLDDSFGLRMHAETGIVTRSDPSWRVRLGLSRGQKKYLFKQAYVTGILHSEAAIFDSASGSVAYSADKRNRCRKRIASRVSRVESHSTRRPSPWTTTS